MQTAEQLEIWATWRSHSLKNRLESPAVQLLIDLVTIKIHGHQAEQVDIHSLTGTHSANYMWQSVYEQRRLRTINHTI